MSLVHNAAMPWCLIFLMVILSSCAGLKTKSPEEKLLTRAEAFWTARVAGDLITCYKFEDVSKTGEQPASAYVRHGGLIYKSAEVKEVNIEGEEAKVTVKLSYIVPGLGSREPFSMDAVDKWRLIEGEWYHHSSKKGILEHLGQ